MNTVELVIKLLAALLFSGMAAGACVCILQLTDVIAAYSKLFAKWLSFLVGWPIKAPYEDIKSFAEWLGAKSEFLLELLLCPFCVGTWFSLAFSVLAARLFELDAAWIWLLWPSSLMLAAMLRRRFD